MKIKNITKVVLVLMMMLFIMQSTILAATINTSNLSKSKDLGDADTKMEAIGTTIFTTISNVGIVLSVVVLAVIGVKYMLGSIEEKAEYKKSMIPYIIGALLVFGASTIGKAVYTIGSKIK